MMLSFHRASTARFSLFMEPIITRQQDDTSFSRSSTSMRQGFDRKRSFAGESQLKLDIDGSLVEFFRLSLVVNEE
jgi:hypothetical protein